MDGRAKRRRVYRWAVIGVAGCVVVFLAATRRRPPVPDAMGAIAAELRVGMTGDEAAAVILAHRRYWSDPVIHLRARSPARGEFRDACGNGLDELGPLDQLEWAELWMDDDSSRNLVVTLGPGGSVTGLRLESESLAEEIQYWLAPGTGWGGWRSVFRAHGGHWDWEDLADSLRLPGR